MKEVEIEFDSAITSIKKEINQLEASPKKFESLRYESFESYFGITDPNLKAEYLIKNDIKKTKDPLGFSKISNEEERDAFFWKDVGNEGEWNKDYLIEVFEEKYIGVLYNVLNKIRLLKEQIVPKSIYFKKDQFLDFIRTQLKRYHKKIDSNNGLKYYQQNYQGCHYKLFNNKLDIICDISMGDTTSYMYGGLFLDENPELIFDHGYPAVLMNFKQWCSFELSCQLINIFDNIFTHLTSYIKEESNKHKTSLNITKVSRSGVLDLNRDKDGKLDLNKINTQLLPIQKMEILQNYDFFQNLPESDTGDINVSLAGDIITLLLGGHHKTNEKYIRKMLKKDSEKTSVYKRQKTQVNNLLDELLKGRQAN